MNRNQKIALGCGGAGCLGLIVLLVVGSVVYMIYWKRSSVYTTNRNSSYNINRNSNSSTSPDSSTNSSMSDDDRHKLFQAAGMTKDTELIQRVLKKIGLMSTDGTTSDENTQFAKDHFAWAMKNLQFITSVNTPEKARAYVEEHIDD